jgi:uncharacterized membrane protein YhaH (DUF805 family)
MSYLFNPYVRLFDFRTRSSRKEYWMYLLWTLPIFIAIFAMTAFAATAVVFNDSGSSEAVQTAATLTAIANVLIVAIVIPLPALAVRRMHDTGGSGWLLFVPAYGVLRAAFQPGTPGANRYGNPPTR